MAIGALSWWPLHDEVRGGRYKRFQHRSAEARAEGDLTVLPGMNRQRRAASRQKLLHSRDGCQARALNQGEYRVLGKAASPGSFRCQMGAAAPELRA